MNDNSKASIHPDSTSTDPSSDDSQTAVEHQQQVPPGPLFREAPLWRGSDVRVTALAVPTTFIAAGEVTPAGSSSDSGDVVGTILGNIGGFFAAQPLLASAMAVCLAGAGYMYVKTNMDFAREIDGFAGKRRLKKQLTRRQLVKKRKILRPSLKDVPARKVPTNAVGFYIGKDRKTGLHLYASIEESSLMLAPMGAGKTAKLGNWLLDAPGAVLATSSKYDIVELTEAIRTRVGNILIWNPERLADRPSNISWDPVIGCSDPQLGIERSKRRAKSLLEGSDFTKGMENRNFWTSSSYRVLKAFLWAADAEGLSLIDVARWSKQPHRYEAIEIFKKHSDTAPRGWQDDLEQQQKVDGKATTLENVFGTLSQTFMFLDSPDIQQVILSAHRPHAQFDVEAYLRSRDTLYMLGNDSDVGGMGPLFTCLTSEVYAGARTMASRMRGGRLDPPMTFVLDEAALICSVPLQRWTADSRGIGITIHAVFQSPAQIYERYGKYAYQTIWDNCVKLILGGLSNDEHIESLSRLTGKRRVKQETESQSNSGGLNATSNRSSSYTWVEKPTMESSDIMYLDPGEILMFRKYLGGPVVATYTPVWDRKDVKNVVRDNKKAAKSELRARKRKLATVPAAPEASPWADTPAPDVWGPQPEEPWAPPAPAAEASPWTSDPAASGWSSGGGFPGPREHLRVVPGVVVEPTASQPLPEKPSFDPTAHLVPEQPAAVEEPVAKKAEPEQLRDTGTAGPGKPTGPARPTRRRRNADDMGDF
ncbi:TraM recognition domain-containing protein [Streptomyces sp. NBC_01728]|uniref:type IV secretory system conjugative DNA transfer family protein n=1 Tax=unclassified Streptomyces TaxID=2593676 RepID=UPI00224D5BA8|nr:MULTISPECIES: type IV secretory system conjugative DNA transfer family protein [unclassified Streptomyces]MCX4462427.1 TraM recognition domain-containing protein [Streptomyces sp. NBC_01719]MCX4500857.1 TraM recognition domain-containing protein [Streptomyces sp. NBC_01728]